MPKLSSHNCPNCKAALLPLGAVFEPVIKAGMEILKARTPFAQVLLCKACKRVVWMDRAGNKTLHATKAERKPRKPKKRKR